MATSSANSIQQAFICLQLCVRHPADKLPHRDLITHVLRNFNVVSTFSQLILYRMTDISKVTNMVDPGRNRYVAWRSPSPARLPSSQGIRCQGVGEAVLEWLNYQSEMTPEAVSLLPQASHRPSE